MDVLVVDVGGTHVEILATGHEQPRKFDSGRTLTPRETIDGVKELAGEWTYDAVSIGHLAPVLQGETVAEPANLAYGLDSTIRPRLGAR